MKKFLKGLGIFFLVICILALLALGSGYAFLTIKLNNMQRVDIDEAAISREKYVYIEEHSSDAMKLVTINKLTPNHLIINY